MADANTALVILACVQGVINVGLMGTTFYYARKTKDIASATKEQADATREQAQAQREQLAEAKAARSQQIRPEVKVDHWVGAKGDGDLRRGVCKELTVIIKNVGMGNASNGVAKVEWEGWPFSEHRDWGLAPSEKRQLTFARCLDEPGEPAGVSPGIVLEYDDMEGVRWRSARELCVENDAGVCHLGKESTPEEVRK